MPKARPPERAQGDRVAIVTGAAKGLGHAVTLELAPRTAGLLLVDLDDQALSTLGEKLTAEGHRILTHVADVTAEGSAAEIVALADEQLGGADVLVNNAGIVQYDGFLDTSREFLRRLLEVDVESVYFMTQAFAASLVNRGLGGAVVNLGTGHALTGVGGTSAYAAAKGAIHALGRSLAVELAPAGIRVNTLALGTTMTERVRTELAPELLAQRFEQIPLGRGATPEEAARAIAYLIDAEYATGTELVLDGGFTVFGDH